jgi:hypothetical protein
MQVSMAELGARVISGYVRQCDRVGKGPCTLAVYDAARIPGISAALKQLGAALLGAAAEPAARALLAGDARPPSGWQWAGPAAGLGGSSAASARRAKATPHTHTVPCYPRCADKLSIAAKSRRLESKMFMVDLEEWLVDIELLREGRDAGVAAAVAASRAALAAAELHYQQAQTGGRNYAVSGWGTGVFA